MSASGSPMMFRVMRNLSGRSARTGQIFCATGLYFRFAANVETCSGVSYGVSVEATGTNKVLAAIKAGELWV